MKKIKKRKNISHSYLKGAAYRYIERYATTEMNLIFILKRKAERIISEFEDQEGKREEAEDWIKKIAENCVKNGLVDDELYAKSKVRVFVNAGNSSANIKNKLRAKGVPVDIISDVMNAAFKEQPNLNLLCAIKYVKKRRFGAFRIREKTEKTDGKETGAMARAGFSFEETKKVLKASREDLEDILYDN